MFQPKSESFEANTKIALANDDLRAALTKSKGKFIGARSKTTNGLPEFDALRDAACEIKDHTLANLDFYLEVYADKAAETGAQIHWARDAAAASEIVADICRSVDAKTGTKGKTMIAEEIGPNDHLEEQGLEVVETDLGEYIVQLRREPPSHIMAPAVHVTKAQVADSFRDRHASLDRGRDLDDPATLLAEARDVLREKYFAADVGITGANFLVAETGSSVIVTNEGNGDLPQLLPRVHIALASLEKIVPTLEDVSTILRVLARSATGQEYSVYTTFSTGKRRPDDPDGPEEYHVVLLDNGRSAMLGGEFQDMLRCIRCGACMNHCPVYQSVGGHAYGSVYVGPMGAVLTPALLGIEAARHLPNASTFCGRCEEVCPAHIPLPKMMRHWREREFAQHLSPKRVRLAMTLWAFAARRPRLYHWGARWAIGALAVLGRRTGAFGRLPLTGAWTAERDFPAPEGGTFQAQWAARRRDR